MPGGFPLGLDICNGISSGVLAGLTGGAINTKGSYVTLIAATPADACWMEVSIQAFGSGNCCAVDIAVGASNVIIAPNLLCAYGGSAGVSGTNYSFPVAIPAGTLIAARSQTNFATQPCNVGVRIFDGAFTQIDGCAGLDAIGFNAATTLGTAIDPGSSFGVKGAYSQLTPATNRDYMGLLLAFDTDGQAVATSEYGYVIDVAIGGSGSEEIIIPDINILYFSLSSAQLFVPGNYGPIFTAIPAGTRIAARCSSGLTVASKRIIGVTAYGIYQ